MMTSDDLAFFLVVAGSSTLAAAARALNVSASAVTQRLKALERRAGVHLIERSGRRLRLTDDGELVAAQAIVVAETLGKLEDDLADRRLVISGPLRVAAPHGFGRLHVAPLIGTFGRSHPQVTVTLELTDHPAARLIDRFDLVVHIGSLTSTAGVVTTLAPNRRVLCASPTYLEGRSSLVVPGDLARHRCLVVRENDEDVSLWRFHHAQHGSATVRVTPAMSSNDGAVVRDWAIAGHGIAVRSEWDVAESLADGTLVDLLPDWQPPTADVVALFGTRHGRGARANAFLTLLRRALQQSPWRPDGARHKHPGA